MTDDTGLTPPEPYTYKDLNEVPQVWRTLRGGRLNVYQVNQIMQRAHQMGWWNEGENGEPSHFVPDYGRARDEIEKSHSLENGMWIPKAKG